MPHKDPAERKEYLRRYNEVNRTAHRIKARNRYAANRKEIIASVGAWKRANKKRIAATKYGITLEAYDALLREQEGVCAICGSPPLINRLLSVDHNHETGKVRSLLCGNCNVAIGHFRDDPALLRKAATYLELHAT